MKPLAMLAFRSAQRRDSAQHVTEDGAVPGPIEVQLMLMGVKSAAGIMATPRSAEVAWRITLNVLGLRKAKKVFAVGFAKAATTSLHALFTDLGLPSYHGVRWRDCDNLWLLRTFDCFSDGIPRDIEKLDRLFPGSKFVLQVRDLDGWIYSRLGHIERHKRTVRNYEVRPDWDTTEQAVEHWIRIRNQHHLHVLEYFAHRPADLLVVNFIRDAAAGTKVANFLGYDGNFDRPVQNVNPHKKTPTAHIALLEKCAARLKMPAQELKYDIYCPSVPPSPSRFPADTRHWT